MPTPEIDSRPPKQRSQGVRRFSIMSILVITTVFAAAAASLGNLYNAASGNPEEIGTFIIITAMLPMVMLLAASTFFRVLKLFLR